MIPIKERRESLGLTQQDVADSCGISLSAYQKYETGINKIENAKYSVVENLSRVLKVYSQQLISDSATSNCPKKRKLEAELYNMRMSKDWSLDRHRKEMDSIYTKENVCKVIFQELVGLQDEELGDVKRNPTYWFSPSSAQCIIELTDCHIEVIIEINTGDVSVYAKYVGGNEKLPNERKILFKYGGKKAYYFITSPINQIEQFNNFLQVQLIKYIRYLNDLLGKNCEDEIYSYFDACFYDFNEK